MKPKKTETLILRVTPELKQTLQALADEDERTLSNYTERLITVALKDKGIEPK